MNRDSRIRVQAEFPRRDGILKMVTEERNREPVRILISIAESILELHVNWCGAPIHPNHNPSCKIAYERFQPREVPLSVLIDALYKIHPVGGPLHSVLDDRNLDGVIVPWDGYDDDELDELWWDGWRISDLPPESPAVTEQLGRSMRQLCNEIAARLNAMPESQRYEMVERAMTNERFQNDHATS